MAVNSFNAQNPPVTTKGDVFTFSTIPTRLGVGANDTVLTADSTAATGLKWASPAAAVNFTQLNSGATDLSTGSPSTVTVSGISGKNTIFIVVIGASATSANAYIRVRINGLSTTTYVHGGASYSPDTTYSAINWNAVNDSSDTGWILGKLSSNAASTLSGGATILGCNASGTKLVQLVGSATTSTGTQPEARIEYGYQPTTSTVSSVSLTTSAGTFDAGNWYVYGA